MEPRGIEPRFAECDSAVIPLDHGPGSDQLFYSAGGYRQGCAEGLFVLKPMPRHVNKDVLERRLPQRHRADLSRKSLDELRDELVPPVPLDPQRPIHRLRLDRKPLADRTAKR